jgi:hypothetical protein
VLGLTSMLVKVTDLTRNVQEAHELARGQGPYEGVRGGE